jgi:hypothetical protein
MRKTTATTGNGTRVPTHNMPSISNVIYGMFFAGISPSSKADLKKTSDKVRELHRDVTRENDDAERAIEQTQRLVSESLKTVEKSQAIAKESEDNSSCLAIS